MASYWANLRDCSEKIPQLATMRRTEIQVQVCLDSRKFESLLMAKCLCRLRSLVQIGGVGCISTNGRLLFEAKFTSIIPRDVEMNDFHNHLPFYWRIRVEVFFPIHMLIACLNSD